MDRIDALTEDLIEFYEKFSSWEQGVVKESGLSLPQMHTLEILGASGNLRMKELAEKMGITTGALTVLVDRLERQDLVARMPHETDRRSIRVGIAPEGRRHFEEHHALHTRLTEELVSALSLDETEALQSILKKLNARF